MEKEKYLPQTAYEQIAARLDDAGFIPLDHIGGQPHLHLAMWNQKNPRRAVKTFRAAIGNAQPKELESIPRAVRRRLYQAAEKLANRHS